MPKNHVRIKRLESGLTQAELAERMPDGVTNMCVSYIEAGKVLPTKDGLKALCTQLLCAPTDLYRLEDLDLLSSHDEGRRLLPQEITERALEQVGDFIKLGYGQGKLCDPYLRKPEDDCSN